MDSRVFISKFHLSSQYSTFVILLVNNLTLTAVVVKLKQHELKAEGRVGCLSSFVVQLCLVSTLLLLLFVILLGYLVIKQTEPHTTAPYKCYLLLTNPPTRGRLYPGVVTHAEATDRRRKLKFFNKIRSSEMRRKGLMRLYFIVSSMQPSMTSSFPNRKTGLTTLPK